MGQVQHPKIKCQQTINMSMFLKYLQVAVADPLITLQCWSTGKIASPEIVSAVCVREKVICLQRPKLEKKHAFICIYTLGLETCLGVFFLILLPCQRRLPGEVCTVQFL